jgi:hypothetical protein
VEQAKEESNPAVIPYFSDQKTVPRACVTGRLSVLCFLLLLALTAIQIFTRVRVLGAGTVCLPLIGAVLGAVGLKQSRLRSPSAWIGLLLNLMIGGLLGLISIIGVGQS